MASDHHLMNLDEIHARAGGHSIYAPSYSATWLTCSGSLIPSLFAEDTAGYDAAYGTVAHELGEVWLKDIHHIKDRDGAKLVRNGGDLAGLIDRTEPVGRIGEVVNIVQRQARTEMNDDLEQIEIPEQSYDITIDEDMIGFVREYVKWCAATPGDHAIERRVDFSVLTPIPKQGGTADFSAMSPGSLVVADLKMGQGVPVSAAYIDHMNPAALIEVDGKLCFNGNPQALLYATGTFLEWDSVYGFEEIEIRICQPRRNNFDVWVTNREELLKFMEYVKERAAAAWVPGAPRTPSVEGCKWCKVKKDCRALVTMLEREFGDRMADVEVMGSLTYSEEDMQQAVTAFRHERTKFDIPDPRQLDNETLEKLLSFEPVFESLFKQVVVELETRALRGERLDRHQLVRGRTLRKVDDEAKIVVYLRRELNIPVDEIYKETLLSPAQLEAVVRRHLKCSKKEAEAALKAYVSKPEGKLTLAPMTDKRKSVKPDLVSRMDDVEVLDDEL